MQGRGFWFAAIGLVLLSNSLEARFLEGFLGVQANLLCGSMEVQEQDGRVHVLLKEHVMIEMQERHLSFSCDHVDLLLERVVGGSMEPHSLYAKGKLSFMMDQEVKDSKDYLRFQGEGQLFWDRQSEQLSFLSSDAQSFTMGTLSLEATAQALKSRVGWDHRRPQLLQDSELSGLVHIKHGFFPAAHEETLLFQELFAPQVFVHLEAMDRQEITFIAKSSEDQNSSSKVVFYDYTQNISLKTRQLCVHPSTKGLFIDCSGGVEIKPLVKKGVD